MSRFLVSLGMRLDLGEIFNAQVLMRLEAPGQCTEGILLLAALGQLQQNFRVHLTGDGVEVG